MLRPKWRIALALTVFICLTSTAAWSAGRLYSLGAKTAVPGEYIVLFKSKATLAARPAASLGANGTDTIEPALEPTNDALARQLGGAMAQAISAKVVRVWSLGTREAMYIRGATDSEIRSLAGDSRIASIEANVRVFPQTTQTASSFPYAAGLPRQLDRIDQRNLPLDGGYTYTTTASNVMVVIPDTGIDMYGDMNSPSGLRPEFGARVLDVHDCVVSLDCSYQAYPNPASSPPGTHPYADCYGHGSEVADIAGGSYAGVAKGVTLAAAIIGFSCNTPGGDGAGTVPQLDAGIEYFINRREQQPNTPYVMIIPSSPEQIIPSLDAEVEKALAANITVVVSAGDTDGDVCNWSPADLSKTTAVISVSAAWSNSDGRISGNGTGSCVTLFAPGDPTMVQYPGADGIVGSLTGTSFSAPIVGGIAALYLSTTPNAPPAEVKAAIVYAATSGVLSTSGSESIGAASPNLLAYSFVPAGAPPGYTPPPPPGLSQNAKAALSAVINWFLNECGPTC